MKRFFSDAGLTLPEIALSAGLICAVSLGVTKVFLEADKKKLSSENKTDQMGIEKLLEASFFTDKGCTQLKNKRPGDDLSIDTGPFTVARDKKIGRTTVTGLKFASFYPVDPEGIKGVAKILLSLDRDGRPLTREIPVPVNLKAGAVEDCRLNVSKSYLEIMRRICGGSFGAMTQTLDCAAAIALVEKRTIEEICKDVYGSRPPQYQGMKCDLSKIHANQSCGFDGKVVGFDAQGNVICG